jgi:hypothetical protein
MRSDRRGTAVIGEDHGHGWGRTWGSGIEIDWSKASVVDVIRAAEGRVQWIRASQCAPGDWDEPVRPRIQLSVAIDNLNAAMVALES